MISLVRERHRYAEVSHEGLGATVLVVNADESNVTLNTMLRTKRLKVMLVDFLSGPSFPMSPTCLSEYISIAETTHAVNKRRTQALFLTLSTIDEGLCRAI